MTVYSCRNLEFTVTIRNSAIAETARIMIRPVTAVDQLTLTVTLNISYVNSELSMRGILYQVVLRHAVS